jgi:hypothetical protein
MKRRRLYSTERGLSSSRTGGRPEYFRPERRRNLPFNTHRLRLFREFDQDSGNPGTDGYSIPAGRLALPEQRRRSARSDGKSSPDTLQMLRYRVCRRCRLLWGCRFRRAMVGLALLDPPNFYFSAVLHRKLLSPSEIPIAGCRGGMRRPLLSELRLRPERRAPGFRP